MNTNYPLESSSLWGRWGQQRLDFILSDLPGALEQHPLEINRFIDLTFRRCAFDSKILRLLASACGPFFSSANQVSPGGTKSIRLFNRLVEQSESYDPAVLAALVKSGAIASKKTVEILVDNHVFAPLREISSKSTCPIEILEMILPSAARAGDAEWFFSIYKRVGVQDTTKCNGLFDLLCLYEHAGLALDFLKLHPPLDDKKALQSAARYGMDAALVLLLSMKPDLIRETFESGGKPVELYIQQGTLETHKPSTLHLLLGLKKNHDYRSETFPLVLIAQSGCIKTFHQFWDRFGLHGLQKADEALLEATRLGHEQMVNALLEKAFFSLSSEEVRGLFWHGALYGIDPIFTVFPNKNSHSQTLGKILSSPKYQYATVSLPVAAAFSYQTSILGILKKAGASYSLCPTSGKSLLHCLPFNPQFRLNLLSSIDPEAPAPLQNVRMEQEDSVHRMLCQRNLTDAQRVQHFECVYSLIPEKEREALLYQRDHTGMAPLPLALVHEDLLLASWLFDRMQEHTPKTSEEWIDRLSYAASLGRKELLEQDLAHSDCPKDLSSVRCLATPNHAWDFKGAPALFQMLIDRGMPPGSNNDTEGSGVPLNLIYLCCESEEPEWRALAHYLFTELSWERLQGMFTPQKIKFHLKQGLRDPLFASAAKAYRAEVDEKDIFSSAEDYALFESSFVKLNSSFDTLPFPHKESILENVDLPTFLKELDNEKESLLWATYAAKYLHTNKAKDFSFLLWDEYQKIASDRLLKFTTTAEGKYSVWIDSKLLSIGSAYFDRLLNSSFSESRKEEIALDLSAFEWEHVGAVLNFLYGQPIAVHHDNFLQLSELANYFVIPSLQNGLKKWLDRHHECKEWKNLLD